MLAGSRDLRAQPTDQLERVELHLRPTGLTIWSSPHLQLATVLAQPNRVQTDRRAGDVAREMRLAFGVIGQDRLSGMHAESRVLPSQEDLFGPGVQTLRLPQTS